MTNTAVAEFIGKENLGYALLALLSDNAKKQIVDLLDELTIELPGVLWAMPPEQLHITLCEIIQPKEYSQDKESLFALRQEEYLNVPARILSGLPKIAVRFDTIEAGPQAIILRASDSSQLNGIREELVANMQLPRETRTPPDITHSSIARYLQDVELEKVQAVVARHKIAIEEEITGFKLIRNEIPPLQKYEVLRTYPLANG
jgi:2'-5' RNA ligase